MSDKRTITREQRGLLRSRSTQWSGMRLFGLPVDDCVLSHEELKGVAVIAMDQAAQEREWLRHVGSVARPHEGPSMEAQREMIRNAPRAPHTLSEAEDWTRELERAGWAVEWVGVTDPDGLKVVLKATVKRDGK